MNQIWIFGALFFLLTGSVAALCSESQVDINSASLTDLDKITWIGPATAEKIISVRPFDSVDDLLRVSGIGEVKLADIKTQGLACVNGNGESKGQKEEKIEEEPDKSDRESIKESGEKTQGQVNGAPGEESPLERGAGPITLQAINLNPQTIKSEEELQEEGKGDYAFYGLIAFSMVLGALFAGRAVRKKRYKNEFMKNG